MRASPVAVPVIFAGAARHGWFLSGVRGHEAGECCQSPRLIHGNELGGHIEAVAPAFVKKERTVLVAVGRKSECAQLLFVGVEVSSPQ